VSYRPFIEPVQLNLPAGVDFVAARSVGVGRVVGALLALTTGVSLTRVESVGVDAMAD
jgi:hypothetical protein